MISRLKEVFLIFLRLGFTSFGGPLAHLGYFHDEFVKRRQWLTSEAYAELVALCQFLPGPASSQVGIAIGLSRGGAAGALVAWLGFTMPSAILMILVAVGMSHSAFWADSGLLHSLKIVAVAVVVQALWTMRAQLCPDWQRVCFAFVSMLIAIVWPSAFVQVLVIVLAGILGASFLKSPTAITSARHFQNSIGKKTATFLLFVFFLLLAVLPLSQTVFKSQALLVIDAFYRTGSLVFGGGHVVLPLLQAELVKPGWISEETFIAGYGAAQAVPGPLFTLSAFLGTALTVSPNGISGGLVCLFSIFLPSFLLVFGVLSFWDQLREKIYLRKALLGINAAVVGLLAAALYHPVWTAAIFSFKDFLLAAIAFILLALWKCPAWLVILLFAVFTSSVFLH